MSSRGLQVHWPRFSRWRTLYSGVIFRRADQFDEFTERALNVLSYAQDEALRINHIYIGTEHLLLELIREGQGIAAGVLEGLGVDLGPLRQQVLNILEPGEGSFQPEPSQQFGLAGAIEKISERAMRALTLANDEALNFHHEYIGAGHLLVGFVREGVGIAAAVMTELGIGLPALRLSIESILG